MFRAVVTTAVVVLAVALVASGCNSTSPTQPQQPPPPAEVSGTVTFATAGPDRAPIASYAESGFLVQFRTGAWEVWTGFTNAPVAFPFPVFLSPGGASATGEIRITAGGALFAFKSVDVYSSITPIPYAIVGTRSGTKAIELADTIPFAGVVGNTFGNFRTVTNPSPGRLVDELTLTLTNPATIGPNPMGLDNIVLGH
jgi:hypothetical protein